MDILLAYSRRHFDPSRPERAIGSAGTLARAWYQLLSRYGNVDYVDGLTPPRRLPRCHYDLFVGIQGSMAPLERLAAMERRILFAVNMHPVERNARLQQFHGNWPLCSRYHLWKSCVSLRVLEDYALADAVFLVGNPTIEQSFVTCGISSECLYRFNYASSLPVGNSRSHSGSPRLLYAATELCLRKGGDLLLDLAAWAHQEGHPFHLDLIGHVNREYQRRLQGLQAMLGDSLCVHGWVDAATPRYRELLQQNDFILFPSLEEGQAGSVLDALSQGLVPLVTRETGISHAPLGWLETRLHSLHNQALLARALRLSPSEREQLQQGAARYYGAEHLPWHEQLEQALEDFMHQRPQQRKATTPPEPFPLPHVSWRERNICAPLARVGRWLAPSRQQRKQLDNYWRLCRFLPHD